MMVPSPIAAVAYGIVKVVGYAYFAKGLNAVTSEFVRPYKFGIAKTVIGLAGGVAYLFFLSHGSEPHAPSDPEVFLGAVPVRIAAWSIALGIFYGFRRKPKIIGLAVLVGTGWSYVLDGLMWVIYKLIPGIVMPLC
jgi:hypothetical protein